jgi:predicted short-subunit dehydrogenase-like oxidoreductase (DUF2520 family)
VHAHAQAHAPGTFALVGPGRAGTTVAVALVSRGWTAVGVAGRGVDAPSTRTVASRLRADAREVADVGHGASLVVVATPDATIAGVAAAIAPGLAAGALVVHVSGACTLHELDKVRVARPDVEVGSFHPLQSMPSVDVGLERLPGSWCAVDGPPAVERLAVSLGMRPFHVGSNQRAAYHAAAAVAGNHVVALLAQAERIARHAGVPPEAFLPLARATIDNIEALGVEAALTGPIARGDVDTVARHLAALPPDEVDAYRALALGALRLTGRDDPELARVLVQDAEQVS